MASWIPQVFELTSRGYPASIRLGVDSIVFSTQEFKPNGCAGESSVEFEPLSRDEANQFSIALKLAAKRMEDIGKDLS